MKNTLLFACLLSASCASVQCMDDNKQLMVEDIVIERNLRTASLSQAVFREARSHCTAPRCLMYGTCVVLLVTAGTLIGLAASK